MGHILVVVDMQNDFISGALGTEEARAIVPKVVEKVKGHNGKLCLTMDTHGPDYLSTQEGEFLPVEHCIKGTWGHRICGELMELEAVKNAAVFEKTTFGSRKLAEALLAEHREEPVHEIELAGLCTDICVVSNALLVKAYLPEVRIAVDTACCAGVTPEKHASALETMRSCQIEVR